MAWILFFCCGLSSGVADSCRVCVLEHLHGWVLSTSVLFHWWEVEPSHSEEGVDAQTAPALARWSCAGKQDKVDCASQRGCSQLPTCGLELCLSSKRRIKTQQPLANLMEVFCTLKRNPDRGGVLSSETHKTLDKTRCVRRGSGWLLWNPAPRHPGQALELGRGPTLTGHVMWTCRHTPLRWRY